MVSDRRAPLVVAGRAVNPLIVAVRGLQALVQSAMPPLAAECLVYLHLARGWSIQARFSRMVTSLHTRAYWQMLQPRW